MMNNYDILDSIDNPIVPRGFRTNWVIYGISVTPRLSTPIPSKCTPQRLKRYIALMESGNLSLLYMEHVRNIIKNDYIDSIESYLSTTEYKSGLCINRGKIFLSISN